MFNSVLISGTIVFLAETLLTIGLFSYLKSEPLSLHMARNQLKTGCAITLSFLESAYITNYLERFVSLVFSTIGSPVLLVPRCCLAACKYTMRGSRTVYSGHCFDSHAFLTNSFYTT